MTIKILLILTLCYGLIYTIASGQELNDPNQNEQFRITFNETLKIGMTYNEKVFVKIDILDDSLMNANVTFNCENEEVCKVVENMINIQNRTSSGYITIHGELIGRSKLYAKFHLPNQQTITSLKYEHVVVIKKMGTVDTIFTGAVAIMVSIIFISFGAALDIKILKDILLKPVGPVIGFCSQFILMPILSYLLGYVMFADSNTNMWLGLFFSGVTPGGGASNMWTYLLNGNVNLSIVMTSISNLAAFVMIPLWIFTLGKTIFDSGDLIVPYERITVLCISLLIPLLIGLAIQKYLPKVAKFLVSLLKPISIFMLVFIISFAIITNYYLFKLFSWKIVVAGMGLPWCGYVLSYLLAWIMRQNKADCLTISIETGLQNTGVAIFLLQFSLGQPEADLTSIVPISVSLMTKVPLLLMYAIQKYCFTSREPKKTEEVVEQNIEEERGLAR